MINKMKGGSIMKKTLASLVLAAGMLLSNNAKASIIEKENPDSYSYSGQIVNPINAVDGDYNTIASTTGNNTSFSFIENYSVPNGTTNIDLISKFDLKGYDKILIDYLSEDNWVNLYSKSANGLGFRNQTIDLTLPNYNLSNLSVRTTLTAPSYSNGSASYIEGKAQFTIPEPATLGLLMAGLPIVTLNSLRKRR